MPPEMLAAWEKVHPEKWSISHIAQNYMKRSHFIAAISVMFSVALLVAIIVVISHVSKSPGDSVFSLSLVLVSGCIGLE